MYKLYYTVLLEVPWDFSIPVVINPNRVDNPGKFSVSGTKYFKHNKLLIKISTDIFFVGDLPRKLYVLF